MSIKIGAEALAILRARLDGPINDGPAGFGLANGGEGPPGGGPGLWDETAAEEATANSTEAGGLGNPQTYCIAEGLSRAALHEAPFIVLESEPDAAVHGAYREAYCRASADVTMRGGTTSGVVYPLALCEIARGFRLRNIGGASAGALAAAAAAAAEMGRSEAETGALPEELADNPDPGHVRPGFAGLSDVMRWLAEIPSPAGNGQPPPESSSSVGRPEYRLAQLFVPSPGSRAVFRLLTAAQRRHLKRLPFFLLGALGKLAFTLNLIALPVAAAFLLAILADLPVWSGWNVPLAGVALLAATLIVFGGGLVVASLSACLSRRRAWDRLPAYRRRAPRPSFLSIVGLGFAGVGFLVVGGGLLGRILVAVEALAAPLFPVLGCLVLVQVVVLGCSVATLLRGIKAKARFGLVSGSSSLADPAQNFGRFARFLDRLCGLPRRTVDRALVTWLSETLSELAGLASGTVLRFGHLWVGASYETGSLAGDVADSAVRDPRRRRVNLELITTELVRGVPYRFPLDPRSQLRSRAGINVPLLYFDPAELTTPGREVLPCAVVEAMKLGSQGELAYDVATGKRTRKLWPLPSGGDLPVVCAARMSLSLPGVFEAVPLYRRIDQVVVRDELGRPGDPPCKFPPDELNDGFWVEQLWFSDGGITSNFPVHFFDSVLPLWPTFGINLGSHPPGFEDQDLWLPQDWDGGSGASQTIGGLAEFATAIVATARGWHDTATTLMPAFRGRVATVRQRPTEGGTNFYMKPGTIASMALRGALAGSRLRRRFDPDADPRYWWLRHQWIRTRIAVNSLDDLRRSVAMASSDAFLGAILTPGGGGPEQLNALIQAATPGPDGDIAMPGDPGLPYRWFDGPEDEQELFWAGISQIAGIGATDALTTVEDESGLLPAPHLRQVPPT